MKSLLSTLSLLFFTCCLFAQADTVYLENPSFEGKPELGGFKSDFLPGYFDCGFPGMSSPDVHLIIGNQFDVTACPFAGNSYVGMVTRKTDTQERFGGKLSGALKAEQCYDFSIHLARSEIYKSYLRQNTISRIHNFNQPVKLRIWGGNKACIREEILAESDLVNNTSWQEYKFLIKPSMDFSFIIFEAYFSSKDVKPYNGNILLDAASSFRPIKCDEENLKNSNSLFLNSEDRAIISSFDSIINYQRDSVQNIYKEYYEKEENSKPEKGGTSPDSHELEAMVAYFGKMVNFAPKTADFDREIFRGCYVDYVAESALIQIFKLAEESSRFDFTIEVKKNRSKSLQKLRTNKLKEFAEAYGYDKNIIKRNRYSSTRRFFPIAESKNLLFFRKLK